VGPRTGLGDMEKRKFLTLKGLELRPLSRPTRSQSLYRLRYPGQTRGAIHNIVKFIKNKANGGYFCNFSTEQVTQWEFLYASSTLFFFFFFFFFFFSILFLFYFSY
jgi:hypothetical protein